MSEPSEAEWLRGALPFLALLTLRDGALQDVEDHMMRDIKGDRVKERESAK